MSWWRCPACGRAMRHDDCAEVAIPAIVKQRPGGGEDQFSLGGTRMTCPDHLGVWLLPGRLAVDAEVRHG